jgi:cell division protease FtsH
MAALTPSPNWRSRFTTSYLILMVLLLWLQASYLSGLKPTEVPYSVFLTELSAGRIAKAQVKTEEILAVKRPAKDAPKDAAPEMIVTTRLPDIDEAPLIAEMQKRGVEFAALIDRAGWASNFLFGWLLPFGLLMAIYYFFISRVGRAASPMQLGKSRAKIYDLNEEERVTFEDVAGVEEAEGDLIEVVRFLKGPEEYRKVGARPPKGILLVGPPGTGKTLLARAVAGEAGVPFFSLSGSEFVEMFVGLGAARVRDLFVQAKDRAPCIVFIDELDAIGRTRAGAAGAFMTHDEREQTLNQLLVEMDGFDARGGVVILAATNRPEVLDRALLRAGRFDRQVLVDRPDVRGREKILLVHARKIKLAADTDFKTIAQRTPGMVGADLANVLNEAALMAVSRGASEVHQRDLEDAVDRMQLGLKKAGRVMNEAEKRRVAYHEAGHALVALTVENADPVHRVTIIPRQIGALGATLQLPTEERYLMTERELRDRICVMLGGRAAEEVMFPDVSTGAENDLERATETARQMICRFGMSQRLGLVTFGAPAGARFLETPAFFGGEKNFSEETARAIDAETFAIIEAERQRALAIVKERRAVLEEIGRRLIERETLERAELEEVANPLK